MIVSVPGTNDRERLTVVPLSFRELLPLELNRSEIDQIVGDMRMALAVKLPIHNENSAVQCVRDRVVSRIKMCIRQVSERRRKLRRDRWQGGLQSRGGIEHCNSPI